MMTVCTISKVDRVEETVEIGRRVFLSLVVRRIKQLNLLPGLRCTRRMFQVRMRVVIRRVAFIMIIATKRSILNL